MNFNATTRRAATEALLDICYEKHKFHDAQHTLITELCEAGTGDQTIMEIAGHVSPQMLKRYSHIRMAAKRKALNAIPTKAASRSQSAPSQQATIQ